MCACLDKDCLVLYPSPLFSSVSLLLWNPWRSFLLLFWYLFFSVFYFLVSFLFQSPPQPLSIAFHKIKIWGYQQYFTVVIAALIRSALFFLSVSRPLFPGVASDIQRASSNRIPTLSTGAITAKQNPNVCAFRWNQKFSIIGGWVIHHSWNYPISYITHLFYQGLAGMCWCLPSLLAPLRWHW